MISSKNKTSDICPTTLNSTFLMSLFNPVANTPHSIKGRVYFLKKKKEKRELNKKINCSFIIENNLILSDFTKMFKLPFKIEIFVI